MPHLPSWLTVGAVTALVAADVVLIWFATQHVGGDQDASSAQESTSGTQATRTAPVGPPPLAAGRVLLDIAEDGTLVRAAPGRCGGAGDIDSRSVVEFSTDEGESFEQVDIGEQLTGAVRVSASSAEAISLVGMAPDCEPAVYSTEDGGGTWTRSAGAASVWHLTLAHPFSVHSPTGRVSVGCDVNALAPLTDEAARVLCGDGQLRGTDDGGAKWVQLGALEGAVDIAYLSFGDGWALAPTDDCDAAVLRTSDGGLNWDETACVRAEGEPQAVGAAIDRVAVQVDGEVLVSTDDAKTFVEP